MNFNVGDKVTALRTIAGVVKYGPVPSTFDRHTMYVVADEATGQERTYQESYLAPFAETFKAGDQVTISGRHHTVQAGPFKNDAGSFYVVRKGNGGDYWAKAEHLRAAAKPANTWEHEGVTYDLSAQYRDKDDDVWTFTGRRNIAGVPTATYQGSGAAHNFSSVLAEYSPLTKI